MHEIAFHNRTFPFRVYRPSCLNRQACDPNHAARPVCTRYEWDDRALRSSYTMRTKCAISDAFVRDCVFAYCASVAQHVYSLSAEHCFRLRNNAISDERFRDCALSTHSVFRPLRTCHPHVMTADRAPRDPAAPTTMSSDLQACLRARPVSLLR